jgi:hypothetical protein
MSEQTCKCWRKYDIKCIPRVSFKTSSDTEISFLLTETFISYLVMMFHLQNHYSGNTPNLFGRDTVQILAVLPVILTEDFCGFPVSPDKCSDTTLKQVTATSFQILTLSPLITIVLCL